MSVRVTFRPIAVEDAVVAFHVSHQMLAREDLPPSVLPIILKD